MPYLENSMASPSEREMGNLGRGGEGEKTLPKRKASKFSVFAGVP